MKPVPPTLRAKKRYIAFKVHSEARVSKKDVTNTILQETVRFYGELSASDFGLWIMEFDEETGDGFLVCNRRFQGDMIACLALIDLVGRENVSFQVLGASGTIKALKRKFLKDGSNMSGL
jgi:ribonuclease P/MRP protein subunit POP5